MEFIRISKIFLLILLLIVLYRTYSWQWEDNHFHRAQIYSSNSTEKDSMKIILLYSSLLGDYDNWRSSFSDSTLSCQESKVTCLVTSDKSLLSQSDAVVVSLTDINRFTWTWLPFSNPDRYKQSWVAFWQESPWFFYKTTTFDTSQSLMNLNGIFNYTASYRDDADFDASYLKNKDLSYCKWKVKETQTHISNDPHEVIANKSELAIWIVSHCDTVSEREKYVDKMRETANVTILGSCGDGGPDQNAWSKVHWHKFYLSFENSICEDYITEKFFDILLNFDIVPVVMGPRKEKYLAVAPPHSFIHVSDFKSPGDLAKYLIHLDNNPDEYVQYLNWKTHYILDCMRTWACALCATIHNKTLLSNRFIKDFRSLWENKTCYTDWNFSGEATSK